MSFNENYIYEFKYTSTEQFAGHFMVKTENKKKKHHWQEATLDTMVQLKTSPELTKTWD